VRRLIARRLLFGVLTLFLVSIVIFAATEILPGNAARAVLGRDATPAALTAMEKQLHLDRPLTTQYAVWLGGVLTGNPGTSLVNGENVMAEVMPRVRNSFTLLLLAGIVGIPLSVLAGILAAGRQAGMFDTIVSVTALGLAATPEFAVGLLTIIVFATSIFRWLPPVSLVPPGSSVLSGPQILVLPVLTLVLVIFPYLFRMMRGSMVEILQSDYVEMARLKGVSAARIIFIHALPNAIAPTIQVVGLTFAYLAGGVVLVEYVFAYPGIGQSLVYAIFARDVPVIQFEVVLLSAFYVGLNIFADIATILVTPKLRTGAWQTQ
jgi:peptide/nickel transport system permease protein